MDEDSEYKNKQLEFEIIENTVEDGEKD